MIEVWFKPIFGSLVDCYFEVIETITDCEKIFIRTRDNKFRITRSTGHSEEFVEKAFNIQGKNPGDLECLCGMVIRGEEVTAGPALTDFGSLVISFDEKDRQRIMNMLASVKHYRKTCLDEEGFRTLAIIPVKSLTEELVEGIFHIANYDQVEFDGSKIDRLERISRQFTGILMRIDYILKSKSSEPVKILLLEPDGVTGAMINRLLGTMGFQCIAAQRWDVAMSIVSSLKIDILIADYNLPGIEFEEFIKRIRAPFVHTAPAIIVLSSLSRQQNDLMAEYSGPLWIVSKPFGSDEIVTTVSTVLARKDLAENGLSA